jgi:inositol 3-alpha-galactosyltransferase
MGYSWIVLKIYVVLCLFWQDFLNMYFRSVYKPIPLVYNLVLAMLWRHPENVELEKVKVVHYCAAVSTLVTFFVSFSS